MIMMIMHLFFSKIIKIRIATAADLVNFSATKLLMMKGMIFIFIIRNKAGTTLNPSIILASRVVSTLLSAIVLTVHGIQVVSIGSKVSTLVLINIPSTIELSVVVVHVYYSIRYFR